MSTFTSENFCIRKQVVLPAPYWNPFLPVLPQLAASLALGGLLVIVTMLAFPITSLFTIVTTNTYLHEGSHAVIGAIGDGEAHRIVMEANGSAGHARIVTTTPLHSFFTYAAGLLIPAWIAAAMLACAIIRVGLDVLMACLGFLILGGTFFLVEAEPPVLITLYITGGLLLLLPCLRLPGVILSATGFAIAFTLSYGVYLSAGYAYVRYIDGDPDRPSDAQRIADLVANGRFDEVSILLICAMLFGFLVASAIIWTFIRRHI